VRLCGRVGECVCVCVHSPDERCENFGINFTHRHLVNGQQLKRMGFAQYSPTTKDECKILCFASWTKCTPSIFSRTITRRCPYFPPPPLYRISFRPNSCIGILIKPDGTLYYNIYIYYTTFSVFGAATSSSVCHSPKKKKKTQLGERAHRLLQLRKSIFCIFY